MQHTTTKPKLKIKIKSRPALPSRAKPKVRISPLGLAMLKTAKKQKAKSKDYSIVVHFGEANMISTSAPGKLKMMDLQLWLRRRFKNITKAIVTLHDYSIKELMFKQRKTRAERAAERAEQLNRIRPIGSSAMTPA